MEHEFSLADYPAPSKRNILVLQGVASMFFSDLGASLLSRGHKVLRVNFSAGDRWFWRNQGAINYSGGAAAWPRYIQRLLQTEQITDILLFGDCREVHRPAIRAAEARGIAVHVFEEGYLRPNWITLEPHGVNGYSKLPREPDYYLKEAEKLPEIPIPQPVAGGMLRRVIDDIIWNSLTLLSTPFYGGYRTHRPFNAFVEYSGWMRRLLKTKSNRTHAARIIDSCLQVPGRAYVLALQLDSDYQIRVHSPFSGMTEVIEKTVASFAAHAPKDSFLIVKNHPLDNGLINHRATTRDIARKLGVRSRVRFIDGGHLPSLLDASRGLIVVNSTVGLSGIHHHCPTITLSNPIYNMPGLTYQGSLDSFWLEGERADQNLYKAFRRVIAAQTQLNGNFYTRAGIQLGIRHAIRQIEAAPLKPVFTNADAVLDGNFSGLSIIEP
ncbi:capsule biosynthesis protein [Lacibacterium aquatile]|uniref:Capsule biosynthesis protein n=1 Tax=Lacibacterium aquatile TaxID=1168082 RepID=A0ABW5DVU0_9PROT